MPTIKRLETKHGAINAHSTTMSALMSAFENAGIEFIPENGGGAGVRTKKIERDLKY